MAGSQRSPEEFERRGSHSDWQNHGKAWRENVERKRPRATTRCRRMGSLPKHAVKIAQIYICIEIFSGSDWYNPSGQCIGRFRYWSKSVLANHCNCSSKPILWDCWCKQGLPPLDSVLFA